MSEETTPSAVWSDELDEDKLPHGLGTMTYCVSVEGEQQQTAETYEGMMHHGQKEGDGKYTWSNGAVYDGSYQQNEKHGKGILALPDGSKYEGLLQLRFLEFNVLPDPKGSFMHDMIDGQGTYTYANGDTYQGSLQNAKRHGQGTYYCKYNGVWEKGEFINGKILFQNGSYYEGEYKDSRPEGNGAFHFASSGLVQDGCFTDGQWTNSVLL